MGEKDSPRRFFSTFSPSADEFGPRLVISSCLKPLFRSDANVKQLGLVLKERVIFELENGLINSMLP